MDASDPSCPFCGILAAGSFLASNEGAVAFPDAFPVTPGHALLVPRRHVEDLFDLSAAERAAVFDLLPAVKGTIEALHSPDGYNVGANVGAAAGQTVGHAHVHLIPRYAGDRSDPRGGVRWVLPGKAAYWRDAP